MSQKIRGLDNQEREIIRQLIRNPRISDNKIAKLTKIPLKTVNRKRKLLESQNVLYYNCWVNNGPGGTGSFSARQLFVVRFKIGVSRQQFLQVMMNEHITPFRIKHIQDMHLAEIEGHLALVLVVQSRIDSDFVEILNVELVPHLRSLMGQDSILDTRTITLGEQLTVQHNYLVKKNMSNGKLRREWPDSFIFVD